MRLPLLFCLFAAAAILCGQEEEGDGKPAVIPEAEKAKLAALLPDPAAFGGKPSEDASFYGSDLYRLIDGGSDVYHQNGFVALVHREYKAGDVELTVDVYDMGNPLQGFAIYSNERSPDYHFISTGAEGYSGEGMLNFLQGAYYVKMQAFGDKSESVLTSAANGISAKIGGGRELPAPAPWLPANGLVNRSQKYIIKAPLAHDFLSPALGATYRLGGAETAVFASLAPNPAEAAKRLASLKAYYERSGKVNAFAGLPGEAWRANNEYEGDVIFFARGRNLLIVQHPPAKPDGFLNELYSSVKD
jgi:hypothetical protein